ncbi:Crp/Fnr family transcriptional regulator [Phaeodactylibacter sp.]|uniref:Crp/Fnr family transcriptional regulator n=1 Tax=Phaeodactylibacter sp. TaxID=1940289 RepID=UPI0025E7F64D|nr:Crp/Fnr family transcriptional regulator [Phaeodactylibacter sp.]MCI4647146.1 Crp/Fnr family transcriptional regulator [Phaeodactylibacter sp.]MCI5090866.1 Crp/Fnr family transcriptional regulator [Phaeodactylibacter sp.]
MEKSIKDFLRKYIAHSNHASGVLGTCFSVVQYPKKALLIEEGQYARKAYYMISGAARSYYLQDGIEVCTWFAFEEDLLGNLQSYGGRPSSESIQLLEDSTLIEIRLEQLKKLAEKDLNASHLVTGVLEEYALFLEERLAHAQFMSSMDKYHALMEGEPEVFQRVSLTHIASYLGISRETLSRLRAK